MYQTGPREILCSNLFLESCFLCPFLLSHHLHHFPSVSHSHTWPYSEASSSECWASSPPFLTGSILQSPKVWIVKGRGLELGSWPAGTGRKTGSKGSFHTQLESQQPWLHIPKEIKSPSLRKEAGVGVGGVGILVETGGWNTDISIHSIPPKWPWKGQDINPQN